MSAVDRLFTKLARVYVPPYVRVNEHGDLEHVDGYWREVGDLASEVDAVLRSVPDTPKGVVSARVVDDQGVTHVVPAEGPNLPTIYDENLPPALRLPRPGDQDHLMLPWGQDLPLFGGEELYTFSNDERGAKVRKEAWLPERVYVRRPPGRYVDVSGEVKESEWPTWELWHIHRLGKPEFVHSRETKEMYGSTFEVGDWKDLENHRSVMRRGPDRKIDGVTVNRFVEYDLAKKPPLFHTPYGDIPVLVNDEVFLDPHWRPTGGSWLDFLEKTHSSSVPRLIIRRVEPGNRPESEGTFIEYRLNPTTGKWRKRTIRPESKEEWRFRLSYQSAKERILRQNTGNISGGTMDYGWRTSGDSEFMDFVRGAYLAAVPEGPEPPHLDPEALADYWLRIVAARAGAKPTDLTKERALSDQTVDEMGDPVAENYWRAVDQVDANGARRADFAEPAMMDAMAENLESILGWRSQWNGQVSSIEDYRPSHQPDYPERHPNVAGLAMHSGLIRVRQRYRLAVERGKTVEGRASHPEDSADRTWAAVLYAHELVHHMSEPGQKIARVNAGNQSYEEGVVEGFTETHLGHILSGSTVMGKVQERYDAEARSRMRTHSTSYRPQVDAFNTVARLLGFTTWEAAPSVWATGPAGVLPRPTPPASTPDDEQWFGLGMFYEWLLRLPQSYRRQALMLMAADRLKDDTEKHKQFLAAIETLDTGRGLIAS